MQRLRLVSRLAALEMAIVSGLVVVLILAVIATRPARALPQEQAVFTDFEGISAGVGTPFSIGPVPNRATFSGDAFSGVIGVFELYFSGFYAWMVNELGTGSIEFERDADVVEFWAIQRDPTPLVIEAYDSSDRFITSVSVNSGVFELVSIDAPRGIARLEFVNGANSMSSIDDLGYTPVPEPDAGLMAMLGAGLLGMLGVARCSTRLGCGAHRARAVD